MRTDFVKLCRHTLGLTQPEFARLLGVSRSVISNIESGYRPASRRFIAKFNECVDADTQEKVRELIK